MKVEEEDDHHRHRVYPSPSHQVSLPLKMSAEFDDVLTNQPIVIDNVRSRTHALSNPSLPETGC
jgi:hypothetical protein